jgi:hypothetical protein
MYCRYPSPQGTEAGRDAGRAELITPIADGIARTLTVTGAAD